MRGDHHIPGAVFIDRDLGCPEVIGLHALWVDLRFEHIGKYLDVFDIASQSDIVAVR
ncbi:hypothetical protein D3C71_1754590 [compost metagenome]